VSGGYSTTDGALAEVSISERNFLGRGLYAKAAVTYGQYARGYSLSLVEPYLLDYRVALGLDLFQRQQLANSYISYGTKTLGFSPRLGFALREDLSLQLRYSIYQQELQLPSNLANCNNNSANPFARVQSDAGFRAVERNSCGWDFRGCDRHLRCRPLVLLRRRSLASGPQGTAERQDPDLGGGLLAELQHAGHNKNPTDGLIVNFGQDFAGVGGDVTYLKSTIDAKYYTPLVSDIVGLIHLQGRHAQQGRQRPAHARSFPDGSESRSRLCAQRHRSARYQPVRNRRRARRHQILGGLVRVADAVLVPAKGSRIEGSVYADAGGLWDYQGTTGWAATGEVNVPGCIRPTITPANPGTCLDCSLMSKTSFVPRWVSA